MRGLRTAKDAWFGGDTLRAADPRIYVTNISQEIAEKASYGENTGLDGRRRKRVRRELLRVTVHFRVLENRDPEAREMAVEAANAWAREGYLEISTKPGRRLYVTCQGRASVKSAEDPKEEYTLTFETAESPYWEDKAATVFAFAGGATDSRTVAIPGTMDTIAEASVTPTGGTLSTLTLRLGDTYMYFTGLSVASGTALILDHDERGYLRIKAGTATKYHCRLAASDDELEAAPGGQTAGFVANVACDVVFRVRGRYK